MAAQSATTPAVEPAAVTISMRPRRITAARSPSTLPATGTTSIHRSQPISQSPLSHQARAAVAAKATMIATVALFMVDKLSGSPSVRIWGAPVARAPARADDAARPLRPRRGLALRRGARFGGAGCERRAARCLAGRAREPQAPGAASFRGAPGGRACPGTAARAPSARAGRTNAPGEEAVMRRIWALAMLVAAAACGGEEQRPADGVGGAPAVSAPAAASEADAVAIGDSAAVAFSRSLMSRVQMALREGGPA